MILVEELFWSTSLGWQFCASTKFKSIPQIVFAFGSRETLSNPTRFEELREYFPLSNILCYATSDKTLWNKTNGYQIHAVAIVFENSEIKVAQTSVLKSMSSYECGLFLSAILQAPNLTHIHVLSDGQLLKGGELVQGLNQNNALQVPITGGFFDSDQCILGETLLGVNEPPLKGKIIAVGFYAKYLKVNHSTVYSAQSGDHLDEIIKVLQTFGRELVMTELCSCSEISPSAHSLNCELLNQTLSFTTYSEVQ